MQIKIEPPMLILLITTIAMAGIAITLAVTSETTEIVEEPVAPLNSEASKD